MSRRPLQPTGRQNQYFELGTRGRKTGWAPSAPIRKDQDGLEDVDEYFADPAEEHFDYPPQDENNYSYQYVEPQFQPRPMVRRTPPAYKLQQVYNDPQAYEEEAIIQYPEVYGDAPYDYAPRYAPERRIVRKTPTHTTVLMPVNRGQISTPRYAPPRRTPASLPKRRVSNRVQPQTLNYPQSASKVNRYPLQQSATKLVPMRSMAPSPYREEIDDYPQYFDEQVVERKPARQSIGSRQSKPRLELYNAEELELAESSSRSQGTITTSKTESKASAKPQTTLRQRLGMTGPVVSRKSVSRKAEVSSDDSDEVPTEEEEVGKPAKSSAKKSLSKAAKGKQVQESETSSEEVDENAVSSESEKPVVEEKRPRGRPRKNPKSIEKPISIKEVEVAKENNEQVMKVKEKVIEPFQTEESSIELPEKSDQTIVAEKEVVQKLLEDVTVKVEEPNPTEVMQEPIKVVPAEVEEANSFLPAEGTFDEEYGMPEPYLDEEVAAVEEKAQEEQPNGTHEPENIEEPPVKPKASKKRARPVEKKFKVKKEVVPSAEIQRYDPSKDTDGNRRSKRTKVQPVAFWKNEKVVYSRRESTGPVPTSILDVIRVPDDDDTITIKKPKVKVKEEHYTVPEESMVINYETHREELQKIAVTPEMLNTHQTVGAGKYSFQKVFSEGEFLASGVLDLPKGSMKPTKNSHKSAMIFVILGGLVEVQVHQTVFTLSKGGQFFVPRGNQYSVKNIGSTEARLFFCHGKKTS